MRGERQDDGREHERGKARRDDRPREVDGRCSRCGKPWPCLDCLTMTPPYVHVWNNV